uniref:Uncharacterized protein n=1 Tax=Monopterus albus TaxID=43700 RepID=A0A3Q3KBH2_MONAL
MFLQPVRGISHLQIALLLQHSCVSYRVVVLLSASHSSVVLLNQICSVASHPFIQLADLRRPLLENANINVFAQTPPTEETVFKRSLDVSSSPWVNVCSQPFSGLCLTGLSTTGSALFTSDPPVRAWWCSGVWRFYDA